MKLMCFFLGFIVELLVLGMIVNVESIVYYLMLFFDVDEIILCVELGIMFYFCDYLYGVVVLYVVGWFFVNR